MHSIATHTTRYSYPHVAAEHVAPYSFVVCVRPSAAYNGFNTAFRITAHHNTPDGNDYYLCEYGFAAPDTFHPYATSLIHTIGPHDTAHTGYRNTANPADLTASRGDYIFSSCLICDSADSNDYFAHMLCIVIACAHNNLSIEHASIVRRAVFAILDNVDMQRPISDAMHGLHDRSGVLDEHGHAAGCDIITYIQLTLA